MLRLTDTTDGRAACNSAIQRDSFAKNLESAWQPVMSLLLGGRMLILHHVHCTVSQSVTPSGSLSSLVMILSITTMRTLKYFYISVLCTVYTYLYNTQLLKNCLKLNPLKIQQDVTSLSGGG